MQAQDLLRFQARKQQYKKLRDDAWRWLRNNGKNPTEFGDYERGDDTAADNPFRWSVQASFVRHELAAASTAPAALEMDELAGAPGRTCTIGDCYRPNAQANPYTIATAKWRTRCKE